MDFNWYIVVNWWPDLLKGLGVTFGAFLSCTILSLVVGILVASLIAIRDPVFSKIFAAYVSIFRNTPLLVQLFFIFYGLPFIGIRLSPITCGIVGIALNEGAFIAEIFRGNIQAIRKGEWEAAESLGLSRVQVLRYAILPQAVRDAIPAITGQVSIIIKDTSLLSLIMIVELTRVANKIYTRTFDTTGFFVTAILYIGLYLLLNTASRVLEQKVRVRR
jgi:polar amino acid transport system permease protein